MIKLGTREGKMYGSNKVSCMVPERCSEPNAPSTVGHGRMVSTQLGPDAKKEKTLFTELVEYATQRLSVYRSRVALPCFHHDMAGGADAFNRFFATHIVL